MSSDVNMAEASEGGPEGSTSTSLSKEALDVTSPSSTSVHEEATPQMSVAGGSTRKRKRGKEPSGPEGVGELLAIRLQEEKAETAEEEAPEARPEEKYKWWTGREKQQRQMLLLFGEEADLVPPIFVSGNAGTGKTTVVLNTLQRGGHRFTYTSCVECFNVRLLLSNILQQIPEAVAVTKSNAAVSLVTFVRALSTCALTNDRTLYIVLDHAEHFQPKEGSNLLSGVLPTLLRLSSLTSKNVTCIFLSRLIWPKVRNWCWQDPVQLHFSVYSKEEMLKILDLHCTMPALADVHRYLVTLLYSIFCNVTRDLKEMRKLVQLLFPHVVKLVLEGKISRDDKAKLYQSIDPYVRKVSKHIYLNDFSIKEWEESKLSRTQKQTSLAVELPARLKWLLVTAYIASHNPPKLDKRLFSDNSGKRRKGKARGPQKKESQRFKMPTTFMLDRLLAIYFAVFEDVDGVQVPTRDAELYTQVKTLVSLNLLTMTGSRGMIERVKLRCNCSLDFVKAVAESLDFDLSRYLRE